MTLSRLDLATADGPLGLTVVRSAAPGAALVIVPAAIGVTPDLETQMHELAEVSPLVVAVDLWARDGAGTLTFGDMPRLMARVNGVDHALAARDLAATLAWARAEAPDRRLVALGICLGGPFAVRAAADGLVDAAATWHATRLEHHLDLAPRVRVPLDLHFGAVDPIVPLSAVEAIRAAFADHAEVRVTVHAGATHGFTNRGATGAYDPVAEGAAMASLRGLLG